MKTLMGMIDVAKERIRNTCGQPEVLVIGPVSLIRLCEELNKTYNLEVKGLTMYSGLKVIRNSTIPVNEFYIGIRFEGPKEEPETIELAVPPGLAE